MSVLEKPRISEREQVRAAVRAMQPGDAYSLGRPITVEEFCAWLDEEPRVELVQGVIQMAPPPSDPHEQLDLWLIKVIGAYVEERKLGEIRGSRSGVRIGGASVREPDLSFFSTASLDRLHPSGIHGRPDLVIEIVDSAASRRNAVVKQTQYEQLGVPELWVVDLGWKELRHLVLEEGRYVPQAAGPAGELEARTIPGLRLRTAWLFSGPDFPSSLKIVRELLAPYEAEGG
jgi:Uma2 family endonuclease